MNNEIPSIRSLFPNSGRRVIIMLAFAQLTPALVEAKPSVKSLSSPEQEIQKALDGLDLIAKRAESGAVIARTESIGPLVYSVDRAFDLGLEAYQQNEPLLAARYLEFFAQGAQVPDPDRLKTAYYHLGRSYELAKLPENSVRSYVAYLAVQVTAANLEKSQLLDVMRRLLGLYANQSHNDKKRIAQLMATITTLDLPKDIRAELYFYAGYFAGSIGLRKQALELMEQALAESQDSHVKAQAHYYRGHLLGVNGAHDQAMGHFKNLLAMPDAGVKDLKDLARLASARLMVLEKKPETALDYYQQVSTDSTRFREAQFERIYVAIQLERFDVALRDAENYLKVYGDHEESRKIRMLTGYLNLRAGKFHEARRVIQAADTSLAGTLSWLSSNYGGHQRTMNQPDVDRVMKVVAPYVVHPAVMVQAHSLFQRIDREEREASDARNIIQQSIFVLGRANLGMTRPYEVRQIQQMESEIERVLQIGHRLLETEKNLYSKSLTEAEQKELEFNSRRRLRVFGSLRTPFYYRGDSQALLHQGEMTLKVAQLTEKLRKSKAQLAALKLLGAGDGTGGGRSYGSSYEDLSQRFADAERQQNRAIELIRMRAAQEMLVHSPYQKLKIIIKQYAGALHDEESILAKYRDTYASHSERYLKDQADLAWKRWESVLKNLYSRLNQAEDGLRQQLKEDVKGFEQQIARFELLRLKMASLRENISNELSDQWPAILDHYVIHLEERRAQHQKWLGDIDWLSANQTSQEREKETRKFEVSRVMLEENLKDLEQTKSWQWGQP